MRVIHDYPEMDALEGERALIGVYVDRCYSHRRMGWLLAARSGFDEHAESRFHVLVPVKDGYGVNGRVEPADYNIALANEIIRRTEIGDKPDDLPCVVFRASRNDVRHADRKFFALKLGGTSEEEFVNRIAAIVNIANKCDRDGPGDLAAYRDYVNMHVAQHCSKKQILHCGKRSLSALATLVGLVANAHALL